MNLSGIVQPASPGLLGFDTDSVVTASAAKMFFQQGYRFCGRYLTPGTENFSANEAADILAAGLALFVAQQHPPAAWIPSVELGTSMGNTAVQNAQSIGLPVGMNLWYNLEGVAQGTSAQQVIDFCKAWYTVVSEGQYIPGLCVGADGILTGSQLYHDLPFAHYWRSLSRVPEIEKRGYQMVQHLYQGLANGISVNTNATQTDNLGGQVLWLSAVAFQADQPAITYSASVNKSVISAHAIEVIRKILLESENTHALITSSARTPLEQAKAMFNNITAHGVESQKKLYSRYGDMVIDVYLQQKEAGKSDNDILKAMESKILEIGPGHVSRHCADFNKLVVVDIAPSSIAHQSAFVEVATRFETTGIVSTFLHPGNGDPAYHIEIPNVNVADTAQV